MDQTIVGVYELGYENIQLVLREGRGGEFYFNPDKDIPRIKIGGDYTLWQDLYTVLLHEVSEFALTRGGYRYSGSQDLSMDTGAFLFIFSHAQFADSCAKAAEFLVSCHKDLRNAWIKHKIKYHIKNDTMEKIDDSEVIEVTDS